MHIKDFKSWHRLKVQIEDSPSKQKLFRRGDIWWCSLGANIGFEEDGKNELFERPVIVVKKFHKEALMAIPLTTSTKLSPYHVPVTVNGIERTAIISQVRLISPKRLQRRIGYLSLKDMRNIRNILKSII